MKNTVSTHDVPESTVSAEESTISHLGGEINDPGENPRNREQRPKPQFRSTDGGLKLMILTLTLIDIFVSVVFGSFLLLYYTAVVYEQNKKIETRISYDGTGWALYLVILSPSYVLKRRCCAPRWSYIWVLRHRYALWIALGLSIFYTLVTVGLFSPDAHDQLLLLPGVLPITAIRISLWICYIMHGIRSDFYDPISIYWPYLYNADLRNEALD